MFLTKEPGESLDHYLTEIVKQAGRCQYGMLKDELVRDRLVSGIQNDRIREKLLSKKDQVKLLTCKPKMWLHHQKWAQFR